MAKPEYLTRKEACEWLHIHPDTLTKMLDAGLPASPLYPGSKLLRFEKSEIKAFLDKQKNAPEAPK